MTPMFLLSNGHVRCPACYARAHSHDATRLQLVYTDERCDLCEIRRGSLGLAETTFRRHHAPAHPKGFRPLGPQGVRR